MRYLLPDEITNAIGRGKSVEQFLGPGSEPNSIKWVELRPNDGVIEVWSFEVEDVGDSEYIDIYSFPPTDIQPDDPSGSAGTASQAVDLAHTMLAAAPDRWLNQGVIQTIYAAAKA